MHCASAKPTHHLQPVLCDQSVNTHATTRRGSRPLCVTERSLETATDSISLTQRRLLILETANVSILLTIALFALLYENEISFLTRRYPTKWKCRSCCKEWLSYRQHRQNEFPPARRSRVTRLPIIGVDCLVPVFENNLTNSNSKSNSLVASGWMLPLGHCSIELAFIHCCSHPLLARTSACTLK